jgi:hypothetical protein
MKNYIGEAGNFIKENKKPLLYIGGAIIIVVVASAIVKKFTFKLDNVFTDKSKNATPFQNIEVDNTQSTISDTVASNYANQLWSAMNRPGADFWTINPILRKIQKKDDFRKVYNAFGKRSYAGLLFFGGAPSGLDKLFNNYDDLDLLEWFHKEVNIVLANDTYKLIMSATKNAGLAY